MVKHFGQFIKESSNFPPSPKDTNCHHVDLKDTEISYFKSKPELSDLIAKEKVVLLNNRIYYYKDDQKTIDILDDYFPSNIVKLPTTGLTATLENFKQIKVDKVEDYFEEAKKKGSVMINTDVKGWDEWKNETSKYYLMNNIYLYNNELYHYRRENVGHKDFFTEELVKSKEKISDFKKKIQKQRSDIEKALSKL